LKVGEGDNRGWIGWMASLTLGTWVWVNSVSWWWTGRPGVLRFMGSQRDGHDWATELNCNDRGKKQKLLSCQSFRFAKTCQEFKPSLNPKSMFFILVCVCVCVCIHECSVAQWCLTLCNPIDYSWPGSSVYGIFQAKILEQVAISYSRGSSWRRNWTHVSCVSCSGRQILHHWTTREAHSAILPLKNTIAINSSKIHIIIA